jgi:hypothetical protein
VTIEQSIGTPELVDPDVIEVGDMIEVDDIAGGSVRQVIWASRHGDWVSLEFAGIGHRCFDVNRDTVLRWAAASAGLTPEVAS